MTRRVVPVLLALAVLAAWILTADSTRPGRWVLGLYRTRWFLVNLTLTWASLWIVVAFLWRPSRKTWLRLGLAHLSLVVVLLGAEGIVAAGWVDLSRFQAPSSGGAQWEHRLRRVTLPDFEWEGTVYPNLKRTLGIPADPIRVRVATDSFGLRNPPGREDADVVCLGDSLLFAWLVPDEENLTARLGTFLGRPVQNISEPSYSPQEELIRLRLVHSDLAGKLVIQFLFEGNDLSDSKSWRGWCEGSGAEPLPPGSLLAMGWERLKWPSPAAAAGRLGFVERRDGGEESVYFLYDGRKIAAQMSELPQLAEVLRGAASELAAEGARYAVVFLPMKLGALHSLCRWPPNSPLADPEVATSPFAAAVEAVCAEAGIPFRDATPWLVEASQPGRLPYFPRDTHLNGYGHQVLAEQLAPWLRELLREER